MSIKPIRLILVDDHELVRQSWRILLETNPDFQIIEECDNGLSAIELAKELKPDVMLVDINMYPMNGFTVTKEITEHSPEVKIIGLSINNDPNYASRMLSLGAKGYVTKNAAFEELAEAIYEVSKGSIYLCREIRLRMGE